MPVRGLDPPGVNSGNIPQQTTPRLDLELGRSDVACHD
jgi:hypothetical protein